MFAVQSSNLAGIDYWSGPLTIAFHNGGVYEFYNVPPSKYVGLTNASSHGKYFHAHIKGRFSYRRISR
jgi:hypothetical protein